LAGDCARKLPENKPGTCRYPSANARAALGFIDQVETEAGRAQKGADAAAQAGLGELGPNFFIKDSVQFLFDAVQFKYFWEGLFRGSLNGQRDFLLAASAGDNSLNKASTRSDRVSTKKTSPRSVRSASKTFGVEWSGFCARAETGRAWFMAAQTNQEGFGPARQPEGVLVVPFRKDCVEQSHSFRVAGSYSKDNAFLRFGRRAFQLA
jgi:hypothetical protein